VRTDGFDIDVQFCVDPVDNGALSSCPAGEGHTWGKVSVEAVETGSVYVHTDVTAVFPWLTHALLSEPKNKRKPMRLMDRMADAIAFLDADVQKRRKSLMKTLDWSVEDAEPSTEDDAKAHEAFVR
jgi:deoxyhypusine synthase